MVENPWLPGGISAGGYNAYANSRPFYVRATLFHLALHAPERLGAWLDNGWMGARLDTAWDRETFRLLDRLRAEKPKQRR